LNVIDEEEQKRKQKLTLGTKKNRDSFLIAFSFFFSLTSLHRSE
jgi:hypothetical protein